MKIYLQTHLMQMRQQTPQVRDEIVPRVALLAVHAMQLAGALGDALSAREAVLLGVNRTLASEARWRVVAGGCAKVAHDGPVASIGPAAIALRALHLLLTPVVRRLFVRQDVGSGLAVVIAMRFGLARGTLLWAVR